MPAALVTGAGRGLGLEIARELAGRGLGVHVTDVDAEAADAAAAALGGNAWGSGLDVRDAQACRLAAEATAERGGLAVWVNNAGILVTGPPWEVGPEQREAMFAINTQGTINGTLAALELMRPAGAGHVINVISLAGLIAAPGEVDYAASKHAAMAFTLGTLYDLRRNGEKDIWLSALCPDGIWTPMLEDKLDDPEAAGSFSGVLQRPADVAAAAGALLDRPRAIRVVPRRRGWQLRFIDAFPTLGARAVPLIMRDARRRQAAYKRKIESGRWP